MSSDGSPTPTPTPAQGDGRIARLAIEILTQHIETGHADLDTPTMVEEFSGELDPNDAAALEQAIARLKEGKPAGGGGRQPGRKIREEKPTGSVGPQETRRLMIPTEQIVTDIITQARKVTGGRPNGTNPAAVSSYADAMKKGERLPPILVGRRDASVPDGDDALYFLIDGWHRFEALTKHLGYTVVECEVTPETDLNACRWLSVQRNRTNAVQYTKEDRFGIFKAYVEAGQHLEPSGRFMVVKAARRISTDLAGMKISARLVGKWMFEQYPNIYEAMPGRVVKEPDAAETRNRAEQFARERRRIMVTALINDLVAVYRDTPKNSDERKEYAEMIKRLPVRMTNARIKKDSLRDYERLFEDGVTETSDF